MSRSTRWFALTGLVALLVAALLHVLVLFGLTSFWPGMIHLMLFGWISAIIFAVNYHMLPVFSGRDFPNPRLPLVHWAFFASGITLATGATIGQWSAGVAFGLLLQLVAALLFVANTLLLFLRGARRSSRPPLPPFPEQSAIDKLGTQATKTAGVCLPLALLLLLGVQLRWIGGAWLLAAEHLTTLGWMLLMIVGVAYHVLPRFSGRRVRGPRWARVQLLCHTTALVLMVPALGFGWGMLFAVGAALMTVALALFAWTIWPTLVAIRPRSAPIALALKERPR